MPNVGPVKDYPENSKKLQDLLAGLRLNINMDGPTNLTSITMAEAVEHYKLHELADSGHEGKAYSTRNRKTRVLNRWILPHWGKLDLKAVKTVAVEHVDDTVQTPLECFYESERVQGLPAKTRWQVHTTTADRPTPSHEDRECPGRVLGEGHEE